MRILVALSVPAMLLLGACAARAPATASTGMPAAVTPTSACELGAVPRGAVFGVRHGVDTATWPPEVPRGATGCQRVWYGDRQRPEAMQVMATYHFENGHVRRLEGRVPGGAAYDCHYREGALDTTRSQNQAECPKASEIEAAR